MLDLLHYSVCAQNGLDIAVYRKLFNKPKNLTSGSSSRSTKPSGKHQRTKCEGLRFILHRTVSRFYFFVPRSWQDAHHNLSWLYGYLTSNVCKRIDNLYTLFSLYFKKLIKRLEDFVLCARFFNPVRPHNKFELKNLATETDVTFALLQFIRWRHVRCWTQKFFP